MKVVYEDNHLIVVSKLPGEIVQGDKTGDKPLSEEVASYLVEKYNKPGKAFVGVVHRLDRPVGGLVLFAKTSKALTRMNRLFSQGKVHKEYLAITCSMPTPKENELVSSLLRIPKFNKSFVVPPGTEGAKEARLRYRVLGHSERYTLLQLHLLTGRHHQIRAQLASLGCPIKGDLKYGAPRSNPDKGISLLSYKVSFLHPVSKKEITLYAPLPSDALWQSFAPLLATLKSQDEA